MTIWAHVFLLWPAGDTVKFAAAASPSTAFAGKALDTTTSMTIMQVRNTISDAYVVQEGSAQKLYIAFTMPLVPTGTASNCMNLLWFRGMSNTSLVLGTDSTCGIMNDKVVYTLGARHIVTAGGFSLTNHCVLFS